MTTTDAQDAATRDTLSAVYELLRGAADQLWTQAEQDGPRSARHLLALGAHTAADAAADLVPSAHRAGAAVPTVGTFPGAGRGPVDLLAAAEQLTRTVPPGAHPPGLPTVVVALCDLIREANQARTDAGR